MGVPLLFYNEKSSLETLLQFPPLCCPEFQPYVNGPYNIPFLIWIGFFCMAIIQTGTHCSGKPSCFSRLTMERPLFSIRLLRMFRSRMTLLSNGSRTQPSRATLSFRIIMPFSFKPSWQRMKNPSKSLSVRFPAGGQNRTGLYFS